MRLMMPFLLLLAGCQPIHAENDLAGEALLEGGRVLPAQPPQPLVDGRREELEERGDRVRCLHLALDGERLLRVAGVGEELQARLRVVPVHRIQSAAGRVRAAAISTIF